MSELQKILKKTDESIFNIPYAFWSHMPKVDQDAILLAEKTYEFYCEHQISFIKTMNNGMYAIEDYGAIIDYSNVALGGVSQLVSSPISQMEDWGKIEYLNLDSGSMKRELDSLTKLLQLVDGKAPVVMTVFSPLTIANKLIKGSLNKYMEAEDNRPFVAALERIADTTSNLCSKAIDIGASGVFFATQMCSKDVTTVDNYLKYGRPYDLIALKGASKGTFNILHMHGDQIMFDELKDYPVDVLNWHIWESAPSVSEAVKKTDKIILGGICRHDITTGNIEAVKEQISATLAATNGKNIIISPGCGIRHPYDKTMLHDIETFIKQQH